MTDGITYQSDTAPLRRALLKHARDAFQAPEVLEGAWRELGYSACPDFDEACRESDAFGALLEELGVEVAWASPSPETGPDSIYVRDAAVVSDAGVVLGRMGKEARTGEPAALAPVMKELGLEVAAAVEDAGGVGPEASVDVPGRLEGGDVVWLDRRVVAVGRGYRTDDSGIRQLADTLGESADRLLRVPLPHWRGPDDVFHLMSILSPLDDDLALVHSPLLPVPFRELLLERGTELVEAAPGEFETQGCNVLAVAPRVVVALEGSPETRRRLEAAGVEVHTYAGAEISLKGGGGPTCLTRTLEREG